MQLSFETQFVYKQAPNLDVITKAPSVAAKERIILLTEEQKEYIDPGLSLRPEHTVPPPSLPHLPISIKHIG